MNFLPHIKPKDVIHRVSTITLSAIVLSLSLAAALPAYSQSPATTPSQGGSPQGGPQQRRMRPPNFLNLTAEQQAKIEQIHQKERAQIEAILTAEQKAQLQREWQNRPMGRPDGNQGGPQSGETQTPPPPPPGANGGRPHSPFASLNLTADQKAKIEAVMRSSREEMDAVLTAEQRQQLQQFKQQHPPRQRPAGSQQAN